MRSFASLVLALALGVMGCSEASGTGGSAGGGGSSGDGGAAGIGGGGVGGDGGGGVGGTDLCEGVTCEVDENECTGDGVCDPADGACDYVPVEDGTFCGTDGVCEAGACKERSWGAPDFLPGAFQAAAFDASGRALVVYTKATDFTCWSHPNPDVEVPYTETVSCIWGTRFVRDIGWETATELQCEVPSCGSSGWSRFFRINVASSSNGSGFASWGVGTYDEYYSEATQFTTSSGWGSSSRLFSQFYLGDSLGPGLAVDASGDAIAATQVRDQIVAKRYVESVGWGEEEVIGQVGQRESLYLNAVDVVLGQSGDGVAYWNSTTFGPTTNRYTSGDGWGDPTRIVDVNGWGVMEIGVDGNGNMMASLAQSDGTSWSLWSSQWTPAEGWTEPELIAQDALLSFRRAYWDMAMNPRGDAVIVWLNSHGTDYSLWSSRYTPGEGWAEPELIGARTSPIAEPMVGIDDQGNSTAMWREADEGTQSLWSSRWTPKDGWREAELVSAENGSSFALGVEPNGDATAVWTGVDSSGMWANRFE